jgi:ribosomal protein S12 methylthiotransferase accessory factor
MHVGYHDLVGTVRARTPEETLAFVRPKLASMGITRIARVTGLDHVGIPVSVAIRPTSRNLSVSQGKGFSPLLADVSAVMESIEFFHAETPPPPAVTARYSELGESAVDPRAFVAGWFPRTHQDPEQDWVRAEDLLRGEPILIPRALVNFDQTTHGVETARLFVSTNGLASGNTLEEATCHALYEIIERDSTARWEALDEQGKRSRELSPPTVSGPVRSLLNRLEAADLCVRLFDATSTTGMPTFVCHVRGRTELRGLGTFVGMGTHHSRDIALSRAVTEAAQSRLTIISGSRDDNFPEEYQRQALTAEYQLPEPSENTTHWNDVDAPPVPESFADTLGDLLERLERAGATHVLRVDHTKPELDIPVVHCFVPGLRVPAH